MADINEIKFSGTIERLQSITTRTGKPMSTWLLKVGQDRFKCVCFGNLADTVLQCRDGDQISLTGTGGINSWKDNEGHWHNDFQLTCWAVEIDGQQISYQKADTKPQPVSRSPQQNNPDQDPPPDDRDLSQFDARPGDYF